MLPVFMVPSVPQADTCCLKIPKCIKAGRQIVISIVSDQIIKKKEERKDGITSMYSFSRLGTQLSMSISACKESLTPDKARSFTLSALTVGNP